MGAVLCSCPCSHLNGSIVCNELLLHGLIPEVSLCQVLEKVVVDDLELTREHPPRVDVAGVGFKRFVISKNLSRGRRGHGGQEKTVANSMPGGKKVEKKVAQDSNVKISYNLLHHSLGYVCFEKVPVPEVRGCDPPHVVLQYPLAGGRPGVTIVRSISLCQFARGGQRGVVDGLEYLLVQHSCLGAVEGVSHQDEGVGHSLNANPDWTMAEVGSPRLEGRRERKCKSLV